MLTDKQVLKLTLTLLGLVVIGVTAGLIAHFAYFKPNFFYGDYVVLSIQDADGNTWYVKNKAKQMAFTPNQEDAAVLQLNHGLAGERGQIFEGNVTTFELKHPYYGAFLTATCQSVDQDPVTGFSTTTGSQLGVASEGKHILNIQKGAPLTDGGKYHIQVTGFDCEASGCQITSACDATGCYYNTNPTTDSSIVGGYLTNITCDAPDDSQYQLWTFTKVTDRTKYTEYKTETDFVFN